MRKENDMKGKAIITLSEAKTGRIIQQMEEHNLVTNALNNIFNPPHYALLHGYNYSNLFKYGLPMWNELLGGVMLLGNNEEESADNILTHKGEILVGTAGSEYAGTCTSRGTLNLNESYETENGYHFTWDFATDKANGTIRCICLTSKTFGNSYIGTSNSSAGLIMSPEYFNTNAVNNMNFEYGVGIYIGTYDGMHVFMHVHSDEVLELRRYTGLVPSAIKINDRVGLSTLSEPVSVTTLELGLNPMYEYYSFVNPNNKKLYFFSSFTYEGDTTTFTYAEVDILTANKVNRTLTVNKKLTNCGANAVFDGHIYILSNDGMNELSMNGELLDVHTEVPGNGSVYIFVMNDCLFARTGSYYINITNGYTQHSIGYNCSPSGPSPLPPYISISSMNTHAVGYKGTQICKNKASLALAANYKATINNLSSPIEKTSEHTLKISYDISC